MNVRHYRYVGPAEIRDHALRNPERTCARQSTDVKQWLARQEPARGRRTHVPATYIVDPQHQLWIADRRSEHVACAGGGEVLAAGELVFSEHSGQVEAIEATNQSTGYCPAPECWSILAAALDCLQIPRPPEFTAAYEFRRCNNCTTINLIKDDNFECAVCLAELSRTWNCDK